MSTLTERISNCEIQNERIRNWIKDKLGPNLEEITTLIKEIVKETVREELSKSQTLLSNNNNTNNNTNNTSNSNLLSGTSFIFEETNQSPSINIFSETSITNSKPTITNQKSTITNQKPSITNQKSSITNQKSTLTNQKSTITNQKPSITNQKPSITNQKSTLTNQKATQKPSQTNSQINPKSNLVKPQQNIPNLFALSEEDLKFSNNQKKKSSTTTRLPLIFEDELPDIEIGNFSNEKTSPLTPLDLNPPSVSLKIPSVEETSFEDFLKINNNDNNNPIEESKDDIKQQPSSSSHKSLDMRKEMKKKESQSERSTLSEKSKKGTTEKMNKSQDISPSKKETEKRTTEIKKGAKLLENLIKDKEEWTDSEEEEEKKKKASKRKFSSNSKLKHIESSLISLPIPLIQNDAGILTTMAKLNISPSVETFQKSYGQGTKELLEFLRPFSEKGGKILFVPPDLKKNNWSFGVLSSDQFFPICDSGLGRSQILYQTLLGVKRALGTESGVHFPHGFISGYDSFDDNNLQFTPKNSNPWLDKCFIEAFGVSKVERFGEKEGQKFHNVQKENADWKKDSKNRQHMKDWFDLNYFHISPKKRNGRRQIFVIFEQALLPILKRLSEANTTLDFIQIIAIPFPDDLLVPKDSNEMRQLKLSRDQYGAWKQLQHYKRFAKLFQPWSG